jgi:ureidoglycolate amidohydrolase
MNIAVDGKRLIGEIEELATISDAPAPAVTRVVFSPTDLRARSWLASRVEKEGLALRQDAIGNTFVRWTGQDASAPAIGTGSHIDAIANAGKYDGVVGVLGGLEAIRALRRSGFQPKRSIELLVFTSEEPTRFGIGCLGSRLLSGTLSAEQARKLKDDRGATVDEVRAAAGIQGQLESLRRTAYRARPAARPPENSAGHCDEYRRAREPAHYHRRCRRTRRRGSDARPARCFMRRLRTHFGHRERSARERWR